MHTDWRRIRAQVLKSEPRCRSCGVKATTVDHIVPRAFGGSDRRENLQPLCRHCHAEKTAAEGREGRRRKRANLARGDTL